MRHLPDAAENILGKTLPNVAEALHRGCDSTSRSVPDQSRKSIMVQQTPGRTSVDRCGVLERVIRRAYVQTAHQAIASDALSRLTGRGSEHWRRLFAAEAKWLAVGALVPDTEFRDFKNHVVFPREGYWGGAIARAQSWYQNLVAALVNREWSNAAYSAGVLAHYVVDALHPLHTAQSEAENDIHAACDLAVETTFDTLRALAATLPVRGPVQLDTGAGFLAPAMAAAADLANTRYESLLAHCDLTRAAADPAAGLDDMGRRVMAAVIEDQTGLLAAIYDRAIRDAQIPAPHVSLLSAAGRAVGQWPIASLKRRRRVVLAQRCLGVMVDEVRAIGVVAATLREEERVKRDLYLKEVVAKRAPANVDNVFPFDARRPAAAARPDLSRQEEPRDGDDEGGEVIVLARRRAAIDVPRPAPRWVKAEPVRRRADIQRAADVEAVREEATPAPVVRSAPAAPAGIGHAAAAMLLPGSPGGLSNFRDRRPMVVDVLGAEPDMLGLRPVEMRMLRAAGVTSVRAFLDADIAELSTRGGLMTVDAAVLRLWQARVRLLQTVPELTTGEADLLAGSGYADAGVIANADAEKVCADILAYVTTPDGKKALATAAPPDAAKIRSVITAARAVHAA
jgi:Zinc dependent phospholipase C